MAETTKKQIKGATITDISVKYDNMSVTCFNYLFGNNTKENTCIKETGTVKEYTHLQRIAMNAYLSKKRVFLNIKLPSNTLQGIGTCTTDACDAWVIN